jgi:molybdate transport system permease protein
VSDFGIVVFTLKVALISTVAIAPFALALAAWSWRASGVTRTIVDAVGTLPLVMPPTAVGYILLELLSRQHTIGRAIPFDILFTPAAVVIACAVMSFPLMFNAFRTAIDDSNERYFDIARTLGASRIGAFVRVTLPLAWRGLAAGVILAWCRAIGEFGATILIAGNIPGRTQTLALAIFDRVQSGESATTLLLYVVVIAFAAVVGSELLSRAQRRRFAR